jgi:RNA polymerase sigma factor
MNNDEVSIGLIAFNTAIDNFDKSKGKNFFDFAQLVISKRIINYKISEKKNRNVYPISYLNKDDINTSDWIDINSPEITVNTDERDELIDFKKRLKAYNIEIFDLAKNVPKHKDSKKACIEIARIIIENKEIYDKFIQKKSLPIKDITRVYKSSRRTINRNKIFITATVIVLSSNLNTIRAFINNLDLG